jgi:tyrosyl-tRNA synthetase
MDGVPELLGTRQVTMYNGFDATADSLHVGHMVPLMALARLQRFGHHPIALAGGGTSMIGDPSGKATERLLLSRERIQENVESIKGQLAHFLDFEVKSNPARLINNADWLLNLNLVDFLRDVGKHFTVNYMISKDSVRTRLEREDGISFTEFSYMLLQSYDFLHLFDHEGCTMQTGGSDQWGNIVAGVELARRALGTAVYGLTFPLITTSTGQKMGKTHAGAVWLDPERTSVYDFYQYWVNTTDDDVPRFLRLFTFLPMKEIQELERLRGADIRQAKAVLALEVTKIVHGEGEARAAQAAAAAAFGAPGGGDSEAVPHTVVPRARLEAGVPAFQVLVEAGLCKTNSEARRLVAQGGAYVGEIRLTAFDQPVTLDMASEDGALWLRAGKKKYHRLLPE